jgi:hypothetical protein
MTHNQGIKLVIGAEKDESIFLVGMVRGIK